MKEEDVINSIQQNYDLSVSKLRSVNDQYFNHTTKHTERQQESTEENLRLYRIASSQQTLYELFCIHCRETMVSFELKEPITGKIPA